MARVGRFEDLIARQRAVDLSESVYRLTLGWSREEMFGLTNQVRRASTSISSNIAEGQGRRGVQELCRFLWIAHGSLCEVQSQLMVGQRLGFSNSTDTRRVLDQAEELGQIIRGLIRSLDELLRDFSTARLLKETHMTSEIGVGLVGYKFMGRTHSNAYRQVSHFFDVDPKPRMVAICGRNEDAVKQAAESLGWEGYETDYNALIARDDIGLIDVSTPGDTHKDVVLAALAAGKHVLCEKPLANSLADAREMVDAAKKAGVVAMVNFNYRRVPAVQLAKRLIDDGGIGEIRHWRGVYLQDWINDPNFPLVWRMRKEIAGSGALGDIAAHSVDLARFLVGDITEVVGTMDTFIKQRPIEEFSMGGAGLSAAAGEQMGDVTVDDSTTFLARFASGASGTFEATRLAPGRRNHNSFEISGSKGSISFNLERMNELQVYFTDDPAGLQGFRTINVTDADHPYVSAWWPAGHIIGYEHTFVHAIKDLLDGIRAGTTPAPSFEDGFRCQGVLDAVEQSVANHAWATVEQA